ncbi:hypothetical protein [Altererythrobacter sp. MTPC7]|uniref:hypothetical protein n=1 Tax=Erythrobacteraceae TaxID=335929 RepID=UPI0036F43042
MRISVFGRPMLTHGSGEEIELSNQRARALIAMLCVENGEPLDREQVSRMLWPGRFPAQAKASLRQCLLALSKSVLSGEQSPIVTSRTTIRLDRALIDSDLFDLFDALSERRNADAAALLEQVGNRRLLEGMAFGKTFAAWLSERLTSIENRLEIEVGRAVAGLKSAGEHEEAARLEKAWQVRQRPPPRDTSTTCSLAVLPFEQRDEIGGDFFLAEGVTDELSANLARISGIRLAGRTSVAAVTERGSTIPVIAELLGVTHVIEGSVHRMANSIRVSLRLVEGEKGTEIWSSHFDGTIEEILGSRQLIGANLIAGICKNLGLDARAMPRRRMTASREAYSLYLQGRALTYRAIGDGVLPKAVELLEQALEIDREFAECWTALAEAHVFTAVYTPCLERVEASQRGADCAKRAIALDPSQGHAHAMLGIHAWTEFSPVRALDHAFEAYRLSSNVADVGMRLGSFLLYIGRSAEALPYIEAAIEQDPVFGRNYAMLSVAQLNLGDINAAISAGRRMVDLGMPGMWLANALSIAGRREEAVDLYYRSRLLMNTVILPPAGTEPMADEARDVYWRIAANGCCSGRAEDREIYCRMLDGLHATMPDPFDPSIAFPAIWMGHAELVMKLYSGQIHPANMFGLMSMWTDADPINAVRGHPGFMDFAERIGLVAAWEKYGWPDLIPHDPRTN